MEYFNAFLCGGLLCVIGQILVDKTKLTPARILVGYVTAGVIISAVGLYQPLVDWAGCGATVPLTGFGHLLAKGVKKAVAEKGVLGALTGGLTSAAGGITAAIFFGFLVALLFKAKMRRYNTAVNRAVAASAAALGASVKLIDRIGYFPQVNSDILRDVMAESMTALAGEESVIHSNTRSAGSTDAGDLSTLMPVIHPGSTGAVGTAHGEDYRIADPYAACVQTAECVVGALRRLLANGGARARAVTANYRPLFASLADYRRAAAEFCLDLDAVEPQADGSIRIRYQH